MIDSGNIWTIASKELRDALRNRWFLFFTVAFAGLALALSALAQPGSRLQLSGFSRTAASLINLVLLFVPLIGLVLGASNLAGDRETGTIVYLLAQPVTRTEVMLGKYLGLLIALFATLSLGFGVAGIAMAFQQKVSSPGGYLLTVILACLLAAAMLSLGFLISISARKTAAAIGGALFAWLFLVFIGDLGIMGTTLVTQIPVQAVFFLSLLNPLQLFKLSSILNIQANLDVLGPAGVYATQQFGDSLRILLIGGLILWIVVPLGLALVWFSRQEKFAVKRSAR